MMGGTIQAKISWYFLDTWPYFPDVLSHSAVFNSL